jgi:hypothetical protein
LLGALYRCLPSDKDLRPDSCDWSIICSSSSDKDAPGELYRVLHWKWCDQIGEFEKSFFVRRLAWRLHVEESESPVRDDDESNFIERAPPVSVNATKRPLLSVASLFWSSGFGWKVPQGG